MLATPQKHFDTTNTYHYAVNSRIKCLDTHGHENRSSTSLFTSCSCQHLSRVFVMSTHMRFVLSVLHAHIVLLVAAFMCVAVACVVDDKIKLFRLSWTHLMVHTIGEEDHHSIIYLSSP